MSEEVDDIWDIGLPRLPRCRRPAYRHLPAGRQGQVPVGGGRCR